MLHDVTPDLGHHQDLEHRHPACQESQLPVTQDLRDFLPFFLIRHML